MNKNRIVRAAILDFYTVRPSLGTSLITYGVAILIGISTRQPLFTSAFMMVFAVFTGGLVFSAHEKSHSEKLYGILPLGRMEMIAGRYLLALMAGVISALFAGICSFEISLMVNADLDFTALLFVLALAFDYYCFAVGVSYPIYFRFTFTKAYAFTMLPLYFLMLILIFLSRRTGLFDYVAQIGQFLTVNRWLIPIFGLCLGLVILAASSLIANSIYRQKEI